MTVDSRTGIQWQRDGFQAVFGAWYDFVVAREPLGRIAGWFMYGTDLARMYRSMDVVGSLPDTAAVLDIPCGGGIAMRGLRTGQRTRYVAADIAPSMLARARRLANRLGLRSVELVEADMQRLPFDDGEFDLCLSYNGFECVPDPPGAVAELVRCLKPGGRVTGTFFVPGLVRRADLMMAMARSRGVFGPAVSAAEVLGWLTTAGLRIDSYELHGAVAYFSAHLPA